MSRSSSAERKQDHRIVLVDRTADKDDERTDAAPATPQNENFSPLTPRFTRDSLQREITKRKYKKYQESRYSDNDEPVTKTKTQGNSDDPRSSSSKISLGDTVQTDTPSDGNLPRRVTTQTTLERGRRRVKNKLLGTKKHHRVKEDEHDAIDILYENQRGAFFLGIPLFSSASLLNFDPTPWETPVITHAADPNGRSNEDNNESDQSVQPSGGGNDNGPSPTAPGTDAKAKKKDNPNTPKKWQKRLSPPKTTATLHPSAVNITNAQLPSPLWEWAWPRWYVDMTGDVDEEGWSYSFAFWKKGDSWHGTHPWLHSFVRRRRWLRKRLRKHHTVLGGTEKEGKAMREAHRLTSEYFTIHPGRDRARSPDGSMGSSSFAGTGLGRAWGDEDEEEENVGEIKDLGTLMAKLRKGKIDREKIACVRSFVDKGDVGELEGLKDWMPQITSLFIFQTSRRQLLALLTRTFDALPSPSPAQNGKKPEDDKSNDEWRRREALEKAVRAADEECKQLEYWSDIRDVVRKGDTIGEGWGKQWAGLDGSGAGKSVDEGSRQTLKGETEDHNCEGGDPLHFLKHAGEDDGGQEEGSEKNGRRKDDDKKNERADGEGKDRDNENRKIETESSQGNEGKKAEDTATTDGSAKAEGSEGDEPEKGDEDKGTDTTSSQKDTQDQDEGDGGDDSLGVKDTVAAFLSPL
ncbi:hypothetical protein K402DRAFT_398608 [Aulographum hederae CBS 113979]|uniref:Peroxin/Ferlin domain-containing protein n=1 Tax=Aulographum hederae CBS 113979 TaxID=1176131 RepID=A0A6G1GKP8_9PEZI|nr:hypothetical protein K402DRAFT_398608 [Aulographum hederae CBS 113979]